MVPFITRKSSAGMAGVALAGVMVTSSWLAVGVTVLSATEASAQGIFSFWDAPPRPRKSVRRAAPQIPAMSAAEEKAAELSDREKESRGPLVINVAIKPQRVRVYDADGLVTEAPVSSGRVGYPTPTGVFSILEKNKIHFSNLYDSAPMPNMQRITWSGVALHAGQLPGYAASHGCIRLPYGFSKKLFGMTKLGTRVIVSRDSVAPVPITHERLFPAFPPESETAFVTSPTSNLVADASNSVVPVSSQVTIASPVAVAAAADAQSVMGPPKPTYRQRRLAELAQIEATLREAGYKRMEMEIAATQAAKAAQVTRVILNKAKLEAARVQHIARNAADERKAAARELAELTRKVQTSQRISDRALKKVTERVAALEAKMPELGAAAVSATAEVFQARQVVATAEGPAAADEANRRAAVDNLTKASADLAAAVAADQAAKRREAKRALPVSVFISRTTQRLYIRQGYEPILDVPVTFEHPDQPVGTHVFTAHDYKGDKTEMLWTAASIAYTAPASTSSKKARERRDAKAEVVVETAPPVRLLPQTAAAALDRITVPEDIRELISDVMKPGSSLVISDNKISGETGKYTDFIVSLR